MKKIILIGVMLMLAASLSSAQPQENKEAVAAPKIEAENIIGQVDSVSMENPQTGTKSTVTIIDNKGEKIVFEVTPTTTIYDFEMKPMSLSAIQKDMAIKVEGIAKKEGIGVANSIKIVK